MTAAKNKNHSKPRAMPTDPNRIPPLYDPDGEDGPYSCPTCGNPVARRRHIYSCGACGQKLLWPRFDYARHDEELAAKYGIPGAEKGDDQE